MASKANFHVEVSDWVIVRSSPAAITGSPVGPRTELSTSLSVNVAPGVRAMLFVPPAALAALMSATRSATDEAVKLDLEAALLADLTPGRGLDVFAAIHEAPGKAPLAGGRGSAPPDDEDPLPVHEGQPCPAYAPWPP